MKYRTKPVVVAAWPFYGNRTDVENGPHHHRAQGGSMSEQPHEFGTWYPIESAPPAKQMTE